MNSIKVNPSWRTVRALVPLTMIVIVVMMLNAGDKTEPYHGKIRSALLAGACFGLAVMWCATLKALRTVLKS